MNNPFERREPLFTLKEKIAIALIGLLVAISFIGLGHIIANFINQVL